VAEFCTPSPSRDPIQHPSEADMVIFDVDEVLTMSAMSAVSQGLYLMRIENGYHHPNDHIRVIEANRRSGNPRTIIPDILDLSTDTWRQNEKRLMQLHRQIFEKFACLLLPYAGAPELVRDTAEHKITAALTSRNRFMMTPKFCMGIITPEKPNGDFHDIVTIDDVVNAKPHPEGIFRLAEKFNIPPSRCVMIGDMWSDMVAAKQAGAMAVGVVHTPHSYEARTKLYDHGASHVVGSLEELRNLLQIPSPNDDVL
jgi:beta-phosphoglucomutase-like phosphatase (HAD superfamily)